VYLRYFVSATLESARLGLATLALFQYTVGAALAGAAPQPNHSNPDNNTVTPIKHVIVIIGENRSFDHVFATYVPKEGESVWNLLSEGIIKADGTPGRNFEKAHQLAATDKVGKREDSFLLSPPKTEFPHDQLPSPLVGGPSFSATNPEAGQSYFPNLCAPSNEATCQASIELAMSTENTLPTSYYTSLVSGGAGTVGLASKVPDTRINNVNNLPAGPFQLTNAKSFAYTDYAASPVHRFYQMWQQLNCSAEHITEKLPSGCNSKLFSWVEVTVGAGTNGDIQPPLCSSNGDTTPCFTTNYLTNTPTATTTGEGSTALGFYNVLQGDAPYFKSLADAYSMSDNFHQSVNGGTGANHIMLGHGDAIWFSDGKGHAMIPPEGVEVYHGTIDQGFVSEIENPNPQPGTNNWYTQDGYGNGSFGFGPSSGGGSYSDCSDEQQPGVGEIVSYLKSLPKPINPRCQNGHYYLLNNYNPGYFGDGTNAYVDNTVNNTPFTIPPSSVPSIGDTMLAAGISWKYYGDHWNNYSGAPSFTPNAKSTNNPNGLPGDPYQLNYGTPGPTADEYCNICNPFQYDTSIMSHRNLVKAHIQDTSGLYNDIANGTLPAVSFVKPSGYTDGHPASSKLDLFEGFTKKIIEAVKANHALWADTAILITFDEGGGYYDSGYVQPLDFFGDGTRIPLLVVSPYAKSGHISHDYADHVSILKFIERNWHLNTVTDRSRDNFPNPVTEPNNPYAPINTPALTDLFDLFEFDHCPLCNL
jgi:phospholipase C